MSAIIADIVHDATVIIGEVAGIGVQQYGEDRIFDDVVRGFNFMYKKYPWHQYRKWFTVTLDGTSGVITTDAFGRVLDFEDFISVHREGESHPLPILPINLNPATVTGTRSRYWTSLHSSHASYTERKLQFYPLTAEGNMSVLAKEYPLVPPALGFDWQDRLELDRDLLAYAGAYMTLVGDALNHDAAETVREFMEARYKDIMAGLSDHPIPISERTGIPNEWYVRP